MSFWFNKPETGSPYEAADRIFNEAVTLSAEPTRARDAERCLAAAIGCYRALVKETRGIEAKRRLAKALWREAMTTLFEQGEAETALAEGREALDLGREILRAMAASHSSYDSIIQEVSGAMNDVAQICHAAGKSGERERLLLEAAAVARRSSGLGARQALGTAVHNLAQHRLHRLQETALPGWSDLDVTRVFSLAERAFEIRRGLCSEPQSQPYHGWELASSALQLGRLLNTLGQRPAAASVLEVGLACLGDKFGTSIEALREELLVAIAATGAPTIASPQTSASASALSRGASALLELIGLLEPDDRIAPLVSLWFPDFWRGEAGSAPMPNFDSALAELIEHEFVATKVRLESYQQYDIGYVIERSVRAGVSDAKNADICQTIARLWVHRSMEDRDAPDADPVRAGISAGVYARRARHFQLSIEILASVLSVACRRRQWRPVVHHLQVSADASEDSQLIECCEEVIANLATTHSVEGHPAEALEATAAGLAYSKARELGAQSTARWLSLRMKLLYEAQQHALVLDELDTILGTFDRFEDKVREELATVRESILHAAVGSAKALQRWQVALDLNHEIQLSLKARGASEATMAAQRMLDYAPILELGNGEAADELLHECQLCLERGDHRPELARLLVARGIVASRRGEIATALDLKRRGLELHYRASADLASVAHAHHVYANEVLAAGTDFDLAGLHWLAATILYGLSRDGTASARLLGDIAVLRSRSSFHAPPTVDLLATRLGRHNFPLERLIGSTAHRGVTTIIEDVLRRAQS